MATSDITLQDATTVFIAGPVSSGKTFLAKQLCDRMERSLIFDAGANYLSDDYEHIWQNPQALAKRLESNPYYYRISYHLSAPNRYEEFHWCFACMWSLKHPRWFIVEEAHEVCRINSVHPDLDTCLRYSRHNLLGIIATSQRIADVDRLLTSSARMTVLFYTQEARDIDAARERWGRDAAKALEGLRPCIYDDVTKVCHQAPECLVITRQGFDVVSLADNQTEETWENEQQQEEQQMPEASSLEGDSGRSEQRSPESFSEDSQQS